ncbi:hypothetical protein DAEQUDRAFT_722776 [Daedalea quercina L-15889]|uniref:Uncharacterized protein n=1 Tax=Daedalea quercina L-15889 TaxID=1314783 RepID=A0A165SX49_9APHY|nr:hypothetical protein DAEQUDRAFT_722776 [Daedalea quercina L-15889]
MHDVAPFWWPLYATGMCLRLYVRSTRSHQAYHRLSRQGRSGWDLNESARKYTISWLNRRFENKSRAQQRRSF